MSEKDRHIAAEIVTDALERLREEASPRESAVALCLGMLEFVSDNSEGNQKAAVVAIVEHCIYAANETGISIEGSCQFGSPSALGAHLMCIVDEMEALADPTVTKNGSLEPREGAHYFLLGVLLGDVMAAGTIELDDLLENIVKAWHFAKRERFCTRCGVPLIETSSGKFVHPLPVCSGTKPPKGPPS